MKLIECKFERKVDGGVIHASAWIDTYWKLKPGKIVSFEGSTDKWRVTWVGTIIQDYEDINLKWRVGGLEYKDKVKC